MCGRLNVIESPLCQEVTEQVGLKFEAKTNRDLRPTQEVSTVASHRGTLYQLNTQWGIQPAWAKKLLINAQAETVDSKPTFKNAFKHNRCVVPCSGWFEWKAEAGVTRKTKYLFQEANGKPLYMAGIYYSNPELNAQLVTLTTKPTEQCAAYHHRMPLLIPAEQVPFWLHSEAQQLKPLLEQPADWLSLSVVAG